MHTYVHGAAFPCYRLYPVTCPPASGVMHLHIHLPMLLKPSQFCILQIKTCRGLKRSYYCGISVFLMQIWLGYKLLCGIENGFKIPPQLLPFTLDLSFLVLCKLLRVMSVVLSAQHVFVQRRLLALCKIHQSLFCL
jgi:hypothetical protein